MLTRLLHKCGLDLGPESELMPPQADNPDGFWENLRFVAINDEVLNELGAAWDLPPAISADFKDSKLGPIRTKARLLIEGINSNKVWGWKDPRNSLTLPFWRDLLPALKTVLIVRHPLEAAYSMHQRNGTSYALGLRLWEIYNRRLIAHTPPQERIVTHYQAFFDQPEAELRRIAAFIELPQHEVEGAAALVTLQRRHTSFTLEQLIDAGVSENVLALYRSLIKEASGTAPATSPSGALSEKLDPLEGSASRLNVSLPEGETIRRELAWRRGAEIREREIIGDLEKKIATLVEEVSAKAVEMARRDGRIEELQSAYARLDQVVQRERSQRDQIAADLEKTRYQLSEQARRLTEELEKLRRELADEKRSAEEHSSRKTEELEKLRQDSDERSSRDAQEMEKLRERFLQTNRLLQSNSIRLSESEALGVSLTERLRKQLQETKRLVHLLDGIEQAAERLRHSRRWLLANPFTGLAAKLAGGSPPGFGHLDKNVEKFRFWRQAHPELSQLDDAIQALRPRQLPAAPELTAPEADPSEPKKPRPPRPVTLIELPIHNKVEVSVIIPVYNHIDLTQACLASLQRHSDGVNLEVIVVDDCSTDATSQIINKIPGAVYLRNQSNQGFIASCNRGAKATRGNYLLFLNNDTTVTQGWLASLLETFRLEPTAGLVGSKLVYPDGRLQEAGGIIWRDGSGWNRGKFQDPQKPEYNYLREVDYCSAASILIPKALFDDLGGFDEKYAPAYYEDADLAFKVAQRGRKVLYQPLSVVIHHEGMTGGTDLSAGTKRFQDINRATFTTAWAQVLTKKPVNGDLRTYETPKNGQKRILVIDHHLPLIDRDSGSLRMFRILTILRQLGHRVTFIPDNLADIPPYGDELRKRGVEVIHHPHIKTVRDYLRASGDNIDVVILSRCDFASKHIADVRLNAPQARVIFDTVDLHFLREEREAELAQNPELKQGALKKRQLEYELIDQADETWVVSPVEQELLQRDRPEKCIEVVSNIIEVDSSPSPFSLRRDILFIGSFQHSPNVDAVLFFARDIFPLVKKRLPEIKFYIIGDKAPPEVVALAGESVIVTGFQPDVGFYFDNIKLSVAPLRYGAGIKGKINQSMGFGVPVVATSLAVEGMFLTDREDVLIGDTPEDFVRALIEVYGSEELWQSVSKNALEKTKTLYSIEAARGKLKHLLSDEHFSSSRRFSNPNGSIIANRSDPEGVRITATS
jgi:GT2 family glycosyltransferase/glycosyltransferase involved in cell wall biosynthesis